MARQHTKGHLGEIKLYGELKGEKKF